MIQNEAERGWLAGLLEGEGYFAVENRNGARHDRPIIQVGSNDLDVIENIKRLVGHEGKIVIRKLKGGNLHYKLNIRGTLAFEIMLTIRDLMHGRRRARIDEVLAYDYGREY